MNQEFQFITFNKYLFKNVLYNKYMRYDVMKDGYYNEGSVYLGTYKENDKSLIWRVDIGVPKEKMVKNGIVELNAATSMKSLAKAKATLDSVRQQTKYVKKKIIMIKILNGIGYQY